MLNTNQKTSLLIPNQLPEYIRDNPDYSNFVTFLQAYYEWMERADVANTSSIATNNQGVTYASKNLLNYSDVDNTIDEFSDYYLNEFLPYFPKDSLISKSQALKVAKQLYQKKGTPSSYKFLFRVLYNSDFDHYNTGDSVFKASDGSWYVSISLKLDTIDSRFLNLRNFRVFGELSKSFAVIQNTSLTGNKMELFISDIERSFQSGEYIRVVDNNNQDIIIGGSILRAKIVGQISKINLSTNNDGSVINRGSLYEPGDPVIIYGGLNPNTANPVGATAEVGSVTSGYITSINVVNGGYGYDLYPNSEIYITGNSGAAAKVYSVDPSSRTSSNINYFSTDSILRKLTCRIQDLDYGFSNAAVSNANTTLVEALSFMEFPGYPISSVELINGGGGMSTPPTISAESLRPTDIISINPEQGYAYLSSLGILSPIQILNGGENYEVDDQIVFVGGNGYGANAVVSAVNSNGTITSITYVAESGTIYPLGGMGYSQDYLPTVSVRSSNVNAANAEIYVPGVLGKDALFSITSQKIGAITTINITNYGEDYISTPNVSLKVQDILVSNLQLTDLPQSGDIAYQGDSVNLATYKSFVYDTELVVANSNELESIYRLRVYNYTNQPNTTQSIHINGKNIEMYIDGNNYSADYFSVGSPQYTYGVKNYGDGQAQATCSFLNGIAYSQGQYLTTKGQPSSFDIIQSEKYNNYTYRIIVEKEIAKYRDTVKKLLHPAGTQLIGNYALKSNASFSMEFVEAMYGAKTLASYVGSNDANVYMYTDFTTIGTNKVHFGNLPSGTDISQFIFVNQTGKANTILEFSSTDGMGMKSEVREIDVANNTVSLKESCWLTYNNVATVAAQSNSNTINITSITWSYNVINNGVYSNTYPIMDIVRVGDSVKLGPDIYTVSGVDGENNTIYTSTNIVSSRSNAPLAVNRPMSVAARNVYVIGPVGLEYVPELMTESGQTITTESGQILVLE